MLDALTLDQLRIIVAVAEIGSFSGAARHLGRVQSAISQSVRALERELRIELFDRSTRRPTLTPGGQMVLNEALVMLRGAERIKARAYGLSKGRETSVSFVVEQLIPSINVIETLRAFVTEYPEVQVTLLTEGLGSPEQRLSDRSAEFAIYSPYRKNPPETESEFFATIAVVPVVAYGHPLAELKHPLSPAEIDEHIHLIVVDKSQQVSSTAKGAHLGAQTWRFGDQSARIEYLLNGFGWCYLPAQLAESLVTTKKVCVLDFQEHEDRYLTLPLFLSYRRQTPPGPAGRWLIENLLNRFVDRERNLSILSGMAGAVPSGHMPA